MRSCPASCAPRNGGSPRPMSRGGLGWSGASAATPGRRWSCAGPRSRGLAHDLRGAPHLAPMGVAVLQLTGAAVVGQPLVIHRLQHLKAEGRLTVRGPGGQQRPVRVTALLQAEPDAVLLLLQIGR